MKNSKAQIETFYKDFLHSFNSGASNVVEHFDGNAVIEYPYAATPVSMNREEYFNQLSHILPKMGEFKFRDLIIYTTDIVDTYWATVHGECLIPSTGKLFEQNYVVRFSISEGLKFINYAEHWNPLNMGKAFNA
jgi:hypothetical protein